VKNVNFFVCSGHKTGKLDIMQNCGILKIRSWKMNFWVVKSELYCRRKPTSLPMKP